MEQNGSQQGFGLWDKNQRSFTRIERSISARKRSEDFAMEDIGFSLQQILQRAELTCEGSSLLLITTFPKARMIIFTVLDAPDALERLDMRFHLRHLTSAEMCEVLNDYCGGHCRYQNFPNFRPIEDSHNQRDVHFRADGRISEAGGRNTEADVLMGDIRIDRADLPHRDRVKAILLNLARAALRFQVRVQALSDADFVGHSDFTTAGVRKQSICVFKNIFRKRESARVARQRN